MRLWEPVALTSESTNIERGKIMRTEEIVVGDEFDCVEDSQIWCVVHVANGYAVMFLDTEDVIASEVVPLADLEAGAEWRRRPLWPPLNPTLCQRLKTARGKNK
jgi:hypothetical protein